jgi:hypothetical protein
VDGVADDVRFVWDDVFARAGETYEPTAVA